MTSDPDSQVAIYLITKTTVTLGTSALRDERHEHHRTALTFMAPKAFCTSAGAMVGRFIRRRKTE